MMDSSTIEIASTSTPRNNTSISVILNENEKDIIKKEENSAISACSSSESMPMSGSPPNGHDSVTLSPTSESSHNHSRIDANVTSTTMAKSASSSTLMTTTSESNSSIELKRIVTHDSHHHHQQEKQNEEISITKDSPLTCSFISNIDTQSSSSPSCTTTTTNPNTNSNQGQKQQHQQKQQPCRSKSSIEVLKELSVLNEPLQPVQHQDNINKASTALSRSVLYNVSKEGIPNANNASETAGVGSNVDGAMAMDDGKEVSTTDTSNGTSTSAAGAASAVNNGCDRTSSSSSSSSSSKSSLSSSKGNSGVVSDSDDDRLLSQSIPNVHPVERTSAQTVANTVPVKRGAHSPDLAFAVDGAEDRLSQHHVKRPRIDDHCSSSNQSIASENYPSSCKNSRNSSYISTNKMSSSGQQFTRDVEARATPVPPTLPLQPHMHHSGRDVERVADLKSSSSSLPSMSTSNPINTITNQAGKHIMNTSTTSMTPTLNPNNDGQSLDGFAPYQGQSYTQRTTISTPLQQQRFSSPTSFANPGNPNSATDGESRTSRTIKLANQKRGYAPIYPRVNGHQQKQILSEGMTESLTKVHGSNSNFNKNGCGSATNVNSPNMNASLSDNGNCEDTKEGFTSSFHHHHHHGVVDGTVTPSPRHPMPASRMGINMNMNMNAVGMDLVTANRVNMSMNQLHADTRSQSVPSSSTTATAADPTTGIFEQQHHHHHHHHHHHVVNGLVPPNAQFITPAKSQSMNHHSHLVDMPTPMATLEFTPNSTANVNAFADGGPPSTFKHTSMSSNGITNINFIGTSINNSATYNRKDKSLGLLCVNFIKKYSLHFADKLQEVIEECQPPPALSIDEAAKSLGVERRRIYDIINILEAIHVVARKCKNMYYWYGLGGLTETFKCLQIEGLVNFKDDAIKNGFFLNDKKAMTDPNCGKQGESSANFQRPDNMPSGLAMLLASAEQVQSQSKKVSMDINLKKIRSENAKEKSLAKLSQKFIQLFLVGNEVIAMNDASDKILGPTLAQSPDDVESKEEKAKIRAANSKLLKTKIRRLYDVANVLVSIGIIQKLNGGNNMSNTLKHRPSFRWVYKVSPGELLKLQGGNGTGGW